MCAYVFLTAWKRAATSAAKCNGHVMAAEMISSSSALSPTKKLIPAGRPKQPALLKKGDR